jgi:hypothetical protein
MPLRRLRTTTPSPRQLSAPSGMIKTSSPQCASSYHGPSASVSQRAAAGRRSVRQWPAPGMPKKGHRSGLCNAQGGRASVAGLVDQLVLLDPGHHGAQGFAHGLDLVLGRQAAAAQQRRRTGLVFQDEALGVFAGLDVLQALRMAFLVARWSRCFGPVTYSPYSALFEIE